LWEAEGFEDHWKEEVAKVLVMVVVYFEVINFEAETVVVRKKEERQHRFENDQPERVEREQIAVGVAFVVVDEKIVEVVAVRFVAVVA